MVTASQLRAGMAIRYEGQPYKLMTCEYHPGQGKMGGVAHVRLRNLSTGTFWEHSFRADLKLEEMSVERRSLSFLYADGGQSWFMDPVSFEQVPVEDAVIGPQARFLKPEMTLPVEFVEEQAVSVLFPDIIEVRIADTAPAMHQQVDSTFKSARLENGVEIMVPQFIKIRRCHPARPGEPEIRGPRQGRGKIATSPCASSRRGSFVSAMIFAVRSGARLRRRRYFAASISFCKGGSTLSNSSARGWRARVIVSAWRALQSAGAWLPA